MKVVQVKARNVKGVRFVEFRPNGTATLIGGKNAAGKSSVLDAICMALGGKKLCPAKPLRDGEIEGFSEVTISGDGSQGTKTQSIVARRTFLRKDNGEIESEMTVKSLDGVDAATPQKLLDDLIARIGFDPLAFMRMKPAERHKAVVELLGIDTTAVDHQIAKATNERLLIGRDGEKVAGKLGTMPIPDPSLPDTEVNQEELLKQSDEALDKLRKIEDAERSKKAIQDRLGEKQKSIDFKEEQIKKLQQEIEALTAERIGLHRDLEKCESEANPEALAAAKADADRLRGEFVKSQTLNQRIRAKQEHAKTKAEHERLRAEYKAKTGEIEKHRAEREKLIASAKWPLPGLGLTDGDVSYNGRPLEQSSTAENIRVSVAFGANSDKPLKLMFVREASLMDDQMTECVVREAAALGCQLFLERVGEGSENDLVIRDGYANDEEEVKQEA